MSYAIITIMYGGGTQAKDHKISTDPDPKTKTQSTTKMSNRKNTLSSHTCRESGPNIQENARWLAIKEPEQ